MQPGASPCRRGVALGSQPATRAADGVLGQSVRPHPSCDSVPPPDATTAWTTSESSLRAGAPGGGAVHETSVQLARRIGVGIQLGHDPVSRPVLAPRPGPPTSRGEAHRTPARDTPPDLRLQLVDRLATHNRLRSVRRTDTLRVTAIVPVRRVSRGTAQRISSPTTLWTAMWIRREEAASSSLRRASGRYTLGTKSLISARSDQWLLHPQRALVGMWIPLWKSTLEHLSAWPAHSLRART